jgi:hypothetical protein
MKFLASSCLVLLTACSSQYKSLRPIEADKSCINRMIPKGIITAWFDASVDVEGRHIGGLLLIKQMPDSVNRVVFTSETGLTIFDFEYKADGSFAVKRIMEQLNKRVVVEVLRKDFAMLLGLPFHKGKIQAWESGNEMYFGTKAEGDIAYFITDRNCGALLRLESGSKHKRKFSIIFDGKTVNSPDNIAINHHTFDMVINLKKLEKDVSQ